MTIAGLLGQIQGILDRIVPFIIGLGVFVVIWGVFTYLTHAAEEEKRTEARMFIVWGVIGVFCMLSIWGFVNVLYNSFSLERTINASKIPHVPTVDANPNGPDNSQGGDDGYDQQYLLDNFSG